ncbi:MAG: DUF2062 domain-containing protein [Opitutaceae bacterium]
MIATAVPPRPSFWQRRVVQPVRAQLTQGVTPDKLAFTLGVGTACSIVPFFGFTTLLNLGVGLWLRLNQPILQILNQLLGPVQLALIAVYIRAGEKIWRAAPVPFSLPVLVRAFKDDPWNFLQRFGLTGLHAATAWLVSVPLIVAAVYFPLRPILRRFTLRRPQLKPPNQSVI